MTSATTWESLRELPARQHVVGFLDQRLLVRSTAPQGAETDATPLQIHLRPYQAMLPQRIHRKAAPQQLHLPALVAPLAEALDAQAVQPALDRKSGRLLRFHRTRPGGMSAAQDAETLRLPRALQIPTNGLLYPRLPSVQSL